MSKQDRIYTRTASDLERKYNFGQSFAEVFGLVSDAQKASEEARQAVEELDHMMTHEEIFNRLTNYGEHQGLYRGADGDIYMNASYIKSGKIAAEFIDAENLEVNAAKIKGTLTADQINLTGAITWSDLSSGAKSEFNTMITDELVSAPTIKGATFYGNVFTFTDDEGGRPALELTSKYGGSTLQFLKIYAYDDAGFTPAVHFGSENMVPATFDFGHVWFDCPVYFDAGASFGSAGFTGNVSFSGTVDLRNANVLYPE